MSKSEDWEKWKIALKKIDDNYPIYKYRNYTIAISVIAALLALVTATDGFQSAFSYEENGKLYYITKFFIFIASILGIMDCWRLRNKNIVLYLVFLYFTVVFNPLDKIMIYYEDKITWRFNDLLFVGFVFLYYKYLSIMEKAFAVDRLRKKIL